MAPVIQKFLVEGSSLVTYSGRSTENLIQYLDKNMILLKEELTETNFERVLTVIWESSAQSLNDTIMLSIEVSLEARTNQTRYLEVYRGKSHPHIFALYWTFWKSSSTFSTATKIPGTKPCSRCETR